MAFNTTAIVAERFAMFSFNKEWAKVVQDGISSFTSHPGRGVSTFNLCAQDLEDVLVGDFGFIEIVAGKHPKTGKDYISSAIIEGYCKNVSVKIELNEDAVVVFLRNTEIGRFERSVNLIKIIYFIRQWIGVKPDVVREQVGL